VAEFGNVPNAVSSNCKLLDVVEIRRNETFALRGNGILPPTEYDPVHVLSERQKIAIFTGTWIKK
jgi:hypothetical protein